MIFHPAIRALFVVFVDTNAEAIPLVSIREQFHTKVSETFTSFPQPLPCTMSAKTACRMRSQELLRTALQAGFWHSYLALVNVVLLAAFIFPLAPRLCGHRRFQPLLLTSGGSGLTNSATRRSWRMTMRNAAAMYAFNVNPCSRAASITCSRSHGS